jgi:hypothetical protein
MSARKESKGGFLSFCMPSCFSRKSEKKAKEGYKPEGILKTQS